MLNSFLFILFYVPPLTSPSFFKLQIQIPAIISLFEVPSNFSFAVDEQNGED